MKFRLFQGVVAAVVALLAVQLITPGSALAHERRTTGKYTFVVGFITEPALEGQPNGIDLRITDDANQPVLGAEKTLKATIAVGGGQPKEFPIRARFGQPGAYTADLIPTKSGSYIFTFTGDINGQSVNEKFESGPGRFNDVQSASTLQFPDVVQPASELQAKLTTLERRVADAESQAAAADQRASSLQTWAMAGLAVGGLGLLVGLYGILNGRRSEPKPLERTAAMK